MTDGRKMQFSIKKVKMKHFVFHDNPGLEEIKDQFRGTSVGIIIIIMFDCDWKIKQKIHFNNYTAMQENVISREK